MVLEYMKACWSHWKEESSRYRIIKGTFPLTQVCSNIQQMYKMSLNELIFLMPWGVSSFFSQNVVPCGHCYSLSSTLSDQLWILMFSPEQFLYAPALLKHHFLLIQSFSSMSCQRRAEKVYQTDQLIWTDSYFYLHIHFDFFHQCLPVYYTWEIY